MGHSGVADGQWTGHRGVKRTATGVGRCYKAIATQSEPANISASPFAGDGASLPRMSKPVHPRLTRKKRVRDYNGRGSIYAWLRAHHGDVARQREVEQRPWLVLVREMVEDGVRREDGKEPSVKNVSRVWERVCRDVKANAAASAPAKRKFPSRISPNWRPQTVPPPPSIPPPPMPVAPRSTALSGRYAPTRDPDMTPEGQAEIDRIWAELVAEDERKFRF